MTIGRMKRYITKLALLLRIYGFVTYRRALGIDLVLSRLGIAIRAVFGTRFELGRIRNRVRL